MVKWFTSLVLMMVIAGSAFGGVPMHSGEKHCPMMGTDDCCEKAESKSTSPQAYAARLCCALNCSVPGTTTPTITVPKAPSASFVLQGTLIPASYVLTLRGLCAHSSPERNQHSPPIYIQHLALLI
jgi:hypothetical protein